MSLDLFVAANAKQIPSSQTLATAVREDGFTVAVAPNFDPSKSCGFVPCPDSTSGFEYTVGPLTAAELTNIGISPEHHQQFVAYDSLVGFHFKTEGDLEVVQAVSSVLARITGGQIIDGESGAIVLPERALAWARGEFEPVLPIGQRNIPTRTRAGKRIPLLRIILLVIAAFVGVWLAHQSRG